MTDRDSFSLVLGATKGQLKLLVHGGDLGNIIEKRDVAEAGAYSIALRRVIGDGRRSCSAVNVKEVPLLQHGHQLFHKRGVGGGLRPLMVVDAGSVWNALHHLFEKYGNIVGGHSRM